MKRLIISLLSLCWFSVMLANEEEVIYQGPYAIDDWGTVEISSIKFHNLEVGDTIYVYTSNVDSTSLGAFQNHEWKTLPGLINGQAITGDYECVVKSEEVLNELKQFGLKIRGFNYVVDKVVIKHCDRLVRTILILSGCIILLLIFIAMGILIWKNRQLSKANQQLYARNMDVLAAADEEKRLKARYEGELAAIKEMIQNGVAGDTVKQKYQNSTLAEDFNLNKLATLVGSNYKNVSQVINELMGKNFNALLNEYRIQEACRRFNDMANFGHYTIEAVGNSVGYGSRSTFVTQFKLITGLTPSEFQNMARQIR